MYATGCPVEWCLDLASYGSKEVRVKRFVVLVGAVAVLVGTAGCSNQIQGFPTGTTASGQLSSGQPSPASTAQGGAGTLPVHSPCSLLSSSDLEQLGASTPPSNGQIGGAPDCLVDTSDGALGVTILTDRGLDQLNVQGPVSGIQVGSHSAQQMRYTADSGDCLVAMGITSSTRVDVSFEAKGKVDACSVALKAAQLVEPHLPTAQ